MALRAEVVDLVGRIVRMNWFSDGGVGEVAEHELVSPKRWSMRSVLNELERRTMPWTS